MLSFHVSKPLLGCSYMHGLSSLLFIVYGDEHIVCDNCTKYVKFFVTSRLVYL